MIYHIVTEADFRSRVAGQRYRPASLAADGFVHCAAAAQLVPVANDFFADDAGPVLVLEIDPERLSAETRYEAPAPIAGGGTSHLAGEPLFPHVYGPIDTRAIVGIGVLHRNPDGYQWPRRMHKLDSFFGE